jgi:hypothetical protein
MKDRKLLFILSALAVLTLLSCGVVAALAVGSIIHRAGANEEATRPKIRIYEEDIESESFEGEQAPQSQGEPLGLEMEYAGQRYIQEITGAYEPAWDLISFEVLSWEATHTERTSVWECLWTVPVLVRNGSKFSRSVRFVVTYVDPETGVEHTVEAGGALEGGLVGPGEDTVEIKFLHEYSACKGAYYDNNEEWEKQAIQVTDVQLLDIDGKTRDELPEGVESYYQDIWVISNSTPQALPVGWDHRKRDSRGILIESGEEQMCSGGLFLLPPGESIIVTRRLNAEEHEEGITQELTPISGDCAELWNQGLGYDDRVRLLSAQVDNEQRTSLLESDEITLIIENVSSYEGMGTLYVNFYDKDGDPVFGKRVLIGFSISDMIPPGEKVEKRITTDLPDYMDPEEVVIELVFVGLSR